MNIKLLVVGKTADPSVRQLIAEYAQRLGHYVNFELEVIPDPKRSKHLSQMEQCRQEGVQILERVQATDSLTLFDEGGKAYSSVDFAEFLQKKMNAGLKRLVFVVGGPYGFSEEVYRKAPERVSLSKMTFSHQMVRPFILEQLYRAFTILRNEPYHH